MGWVIERATGVRYADLVSELLWRPMGAERSAYITLDRLGAPRCAGGFCASARDLARLGLLLSEGGRYGGKQIVPSSWIEDLFTKGDPRAWDAGDFIKYFPQMNVHYRSKWYVLRGDAPMAFGVGVFGQNLFIDPKNEIVIAKFSSQALPMDEKRILLTMQRHRRDTYLSGGAAADVNILFLSDTLMFKCKRAGLEHSRANTDRTRRVALHTILFKFTGIPQS